MTDRIDFVVNGQSTSLSKRDVEKKMLGVTPEPIRNLGVVVGGIRFPVKQVFGTVTGFDRLDFTSATARRHLGKLGFQLVRETS